MHQRSRRHRGWGRGSGSSSEGQAVQQAHQRDALRRVTPLACASVVPRLVRALCATLARRQNGKCSLNTTTTPNISRQGGFGREGALVKFAPHRKTSSASASSAGPRSSRSPSRAWPVSQRRRPRKGHELTGRNACPALPRAVEHCGAVKSQSRFTRAVGCHESGVHFTQPSAVAPSLQVASRLG